MIRRLIVIALLALALMPGTVSAQEMGSPEDNACNPGGSMYRADPNEGCTSEWHWVCGYYLARFYSRSYNMGGYDTSLLPDWCSSLLPARPAIPAAISIRSGGGGGGGGDNGGGDVPVGVCVNGTTASLVFNGQYGVAGNITWYDGLDCDDALINTTAIIAKAASSSEAVTFCQTINPNINIAIPMNPYPGFAADDWICYIT